MILCIQELLKREDIDVNARDEDRHTALTWAVDKGDLNIIRELLGNPNLDLNPVDDDGLSPLILACKPNEEDRSEVVKLLINDPRTDVNITVFLLFILL